MKLALRPKVSLRSLAVVGFASLALTLGACGGPVGGGGGEQEPEGQGQEGGSATSGTVNWWGWTPTDTATANGYIAAFNKEYPDIKVNFKLVSIPDWQAALTPALRSDSGPDVFDMQPGSYVASYCFASRWCTCIRSRRSSASTAPSSSGSPRPARAEDILISVVENGYEDWYAGRL